MMDQPNEIREHACGAYPVTGECSWCHGPTHRGDAGGMQGRYYWCDDETCGRPTLVIDWCECDEDVE